MSAFYQTAEMKSCAKIDYGFKHVTVKSRCPVTVFKNSAFQTLTLVSGVTTICQASVRDWTGPVCLEASLFTSTSLRLTSPHCTQSTTLAPSTLPRILQPANSIAGAFQSLPPISLHSLDTIAFLQPPTKTPIQFHDPTPPGKGSATAHLPSSQTSIQTSLHTAPSTHSLRAQDGVRRLRDVMRTGGYPAVCGGGQDHTHLWLVRDRGRLLCAQHRAGQHDYLPRRCVVHAHCGPDHDGYNDLARPQ